MARAVARLATADDVPALVPMLARAFATDPFVSWFVRDDEHRDRGFQRWFALGLEQLTLPFGEVYTNDDQSGAALWAPPGRWRMGFLRELLLARTFASICGWRRLLHLQRATGPIVAAHPHEPHHYLFHLGVEPAMQGRGIGRALVEPVLAMCDRDDLPAYLETATEKNLGLYRSLGFEVTGEHQIANGPHLWFMWRPRREKRAFSSSQ